MNGLQPSNVRTAQSFLLIILAVSILSLDQLTKYLVRANMEWGQSIPSEGFIRLTYTTNSGGAFGIFANQTFLLAIAAVLGILVFLFYFRYIPLENRLLQVGLGLDLGGALGNLIDRLRFVEVTDFIDIGPWPVFNVADSAIVVGTILIVYYLIFIAQKKARG